MSAQEPIAAAAAEYRRALLQLVAEVARASFLAQAASIALLDRPAGDFVFEAVCGGGGRDLVGARFRAREGLAGVVARTGEAIVVDDLSSHPDFAYEVATETGYVPSAMMIAPLTVDDRILGVLFVLDRGPTGRSDAQELELLRQLATHAVRGLEQADALARAATRGAPPGTA